MRAIISLTAALLVAQGAAAQPEDALAARERERIRDHLAHVELILRARDTSHLTAAQREARAEALDRLRAYREAGQFPRNTRHPEQYLPYFIDDYGTACAVAHLVIESGAEDLARRVADRENNAYVPEMTTPGLHDWAEASGLTVDELAMIQPSYCGPYFDAEPCDDADAGTGGGRRDDGGCSVSASGAPPAAPVALMLLVLLGLTVSRRRGRGHPLRR